MPSRKFLIYNKKIDNNLSNAIIALDSNLSIDEGAIVAPFEYSLDQILLIVAAADLEVSHGVMLLRSRNSSGKN